MQTQSRYTLFSSVDLDGVTEVKIENKSQKYAVKLLKFTIPSLKDVCCFVDKNRKGQKNVL